METRRNIFVLIQFAILFFTVQLIGSIQGEQIPEIHHQNLSEYQMHIASGELRRACANSGIQTQPTTRINTGNRLQSLRQVLENSALYGISPKLDALLITSYDDHQTDFVSNYDKRLEYISGFSGSRGDAIVTMEDAVLWVDKTYYLQADDQLDCNWLLMKEGNHLVASKAKWLNQKFPKGARIGADPKLLSADEWHAFEAELKTYNKKLELIKTNVNLIDVVWKNHNRTEEKKEAFTIHHYYTGKNWTTKVKELRSKLKKLNIQAIVVTALDEIAWLLNIRGRDIPYTRFVKSYVLLSDMEILFYVHESKVKDNVTVFFNAKYPGYTYYTVQIKPYDAFWKDLPTYCQTWKSILVPSSCVFSPGVSKKVYDLVDSNLRVSLPSPIIHMKAVKNPTEIDGMIKAHVRDAAAMCEFFEDLESRFKANDIWDELKMAKRLDDIRLEQDLAVNISFRTIVAFGENGGQSNYETSVTTSHQIFDNNTIIIRSGGQYCDGTTEVSRTIHLGKPTDFQKECYTRALIGSIQLSTATIPDDMLISNVDVMIRSPIWAMGQDYPYSTGHGIGAFLGVRESPIDVSYYSKSNKETFKHGNFFAISPGIYHLNKFGVRLGNVLMVKQRKHLGSYSGNSYLGFKDITLVPYSIKLMKMELLSDQHRRWLNIYNARIRRYVGAELKRKNATDAFFWMMDNTGYIPEYSRASLQNSASFYNLLISVFCFKFVVYFLL